MADAENFRISGFSGLPQDSQETCWAACAAMQQSVKKRKTLYESDVLKPYPYYDNIFDNKQSMNLSGMRDLYVTKLGMTEGTIDLTDRRRLADFIKAKAPIIVGSAAVTFPQGGGVTHIGYHVRIITGYWGYPDSTDADSLQIRIFDPFPPAGFLIETPYMFSHFKYQMDLKTGGLPAVVGAIWY